MAWFFTGRRSLYRFNGVLRTVTRKEELSRVVDPILHVFLSQSLPFFWADWPDAGTPGWPEYLSSKRIPFVRMNAIPAMARKLDSLPQASLSKEVEIIRVETNGIKMTG